MQDAKGFGLKLGAFFAGLSALCGIILYTVPDLALKIVDYLTHSTIAFAVKPFEPIGFVIGLVLWFAIGSAAGYIIAKMC